MRYFRISLDDGDAVAGAEQLAPNLSAACSSAVREALTAVLEQDIASNAKRRVTACVYDPANADARRIVVTVQIEAFDY